MSDNILFPHLNSPFKIGNTTFKNRMIVSPMGSGGTLETTGYRGEYSDKGIEYIVERARGGFGLIYMGGDFMPDYIVDPHDPIDATLKAPQYFRKQALKLNERLSFYDAKCIQQLCVGMGRDDGGPGASETPLWADPSTNNTALTVDQIHKKTDIIVEAAKLCKDSGFAGVEVHALHWGYLLDEFATPFFNRRTDEYGGCLENRLRFAREILDGIKQECGSDFIVTTRLGLQSFMKGFNQATLTGEGEVGRTLEDSIEIAIELEKYGFDALSVDVGTYESFYYCCPPQYMPFGHVIPFAAEVKKHVNIPILCGSRMSNPYKSEQALAEGKIDAVVLGRATLADPQYAKKIEMGTPEKIRPCIGCIVGCMGKVMNGEAITCAVNPAARDELNYGVKKTLTPKKVAVIGGGVAGLEAARTAKLRGFDVTIYERTGTLGGNLIPAGAHSFKIELHQLVEWYKREIAELKIPVEYYSDMTAERIKAIRPDVAIISTGSVPVMPASIPGIDKKNCISGIEALRGNRDLGKNLVVVGGGLVGCEFAIDKAKEGHNVTIVEAAPKVLAASEQIAIMVELMIPDLIEHHGVKTMCSHKIVEITDEGAVIEPTEGGERITLPADQVIMCIGMKPRKNDLAEQLKGSGIEVFTVGDASKPGMVYSSVHSAYEVVRML